MTQENNSNKLLNELTSLKKELQLEREKRKTAEEKIQNLENNNPLKKGNDIFQSLIQNSSDIITLMDENGIISYTSSSIEEILGYKETELCGKSIFEFLHPEEIPFISSELKFTLEQSGKSRKIECRFLNKKGEYVYLEAQGNNQISNPSINQIVVNSRDISHRINSEKELKNSEEQKNKILSSITDAFIAIDKNWNLTYINKRANVLFNRVNKELIGKSFWEAFAEVNGLEYYKKYSIASTKTKYTEFEYFYNRLQKWMKVKIYPSKNGLSIFYTDITEEKIQRTILELEQYSLIENSKRNKRLNEIIDEAILRMESIIPGMICSISMVSENKQKLINFSSPSLPNSFIKVIDGINIENNLGTASTAAYRNEIVISSNIQADEKWVRLKQFADEETLKACWSFPIVSTSGEILSVFSVYFKKETSPSKMDLAFFYRVRLILSNLIEGRKKEDELNKLSLIAKNTNKAVFITDLDLKTTWVNSAFSMITGYEPEEIIGQNPIQLLNGPKSDPETINQIIDQISDNEQFTINTIFHKKNGEIYWSRITGQPMYDEAGKINQYFAIQEDTTARKLAKIDLQDSEKRYRALFHSNSQPMYIYDKATLGFTEVNESAVNTYGYTPDEFNSMLVTELLEDTLRENYDPNNDKINYRNNILNTSEIVTDFSIHKTKTGKLMNVEIIRNEMIISGKAAILVIINDVTKKLITEKKLIQSNERFTLASKAVNEAIWDFDYLSKTLHWADGLSHLFGYKDNSEFPTAENWHTFVHPDDYAEAKIDFDLALENKTVDYWDREYRFIRKDKTYAYILDRAYIVRDKKGLPTRVIGAMQDISKQKNFEIQKLSLISETQEHERKRFSMELHDGLAQHLVALNLYLSQIDEDQIVDPITLENCFKILKTSMNQTRALCYSLTPPELEHGFLLAIEAMFERLKAVKAFNVALIINSKLKDADFVNVDKYNLYRIIQEFVNNSIKHSNGSLISCKINKQNNSIIIDTCDNGQGFDIHQQSNSLGLKNIEQRARLAKINYTLKSEIAKGTEMKIILK